MKRFAWLVLVAFCTALAQVQPADMPARKQAVCGCCEKPGACGMPDCAPLPAACQPAFVAETPAGLTAEARQPAPAGRTRQVEIHVGIDYCLADLPPRPDPREHAAPAGEPLFRVHCSYLI